MRTLTLFFLLLISFQCVFADWWDRFSPPLKLQFDKVVENPETFNGVVVKFTVRFHELGSYYQRGYTQFGDSRYFNFSVWPLERKLWVKEDYVNDYKFLYMSKTDKEINTLLGLQKYDTITILGKVKSKFNGKAWIQVVSIQKERGFLTKKLISALILAHRQVDQKEYQMAIDTLRYILDYNVPVDIRGYCLKILGRIYYEIDDIIPAAYEFKKALKILRYDAELQKWYKECYRIIVREGLKTEYELYKGVPRRVRDDYPVRKDPIRRDLELNPPSKRQPTTSFPASEGGSSDDFANDDFVSDDAAGDDDDDAAGDDDDDDMAGDDDDDMAGDDDDDAGDDDDDDDDDAGDDDDFGASEGDSNFDDDEDW